ncbi:MAG: tetratricopeptide repeat protein [Pseudomonadota bacterium]|nr:tetratricopeptide repeat protein [Pseudomonadota bacterium]
MSTYETDEERVEALRKWWKENGTSIVAGVALGVGALVGWRGWVSWQDGQSKAASSVYAQVMEAGKRDDTETARRQARALREDYGSTPYAALAGLELARFHAESGDLESAAVELRQVMDDAGEDSSRDVARVRLARVLVVSGKPGEALELLSDALPGPWMSLVEEARGDAYRGLGDFDKARMAYDRALLATGGNAEYLRMKRDELGSGATADGE